MTEARPLAVVDIDGVLADVRHRLHHIRRKPKDWASFFRAAVEDPPHDEGLALVARLSRDHDIVLLTGRPESTRDDTERWLAGHGVRYERLLMRAHDDRRPAARVKREALRALARNRTIAVVVDDDPVVVTELTRAGHHVVHATWEVEDPALLEAQEVEGRT